VAAFRYEFPVDALIQRLKYGSQTVIAGYLADVLADAVAGEAGPDLILPMPLHPLRLRERGFNQAVLLARQLSQRLGIALDSTACRRVRDTRPQVDLPLGERRRNIRHAFACNADLGGRRVVLVDDVMTSGASLDELARVVVQAGAAEVSVWVVARALRG
jgi:ComF family protein